MSKNQNKKQQRIIHKGATNAEREANDLISKGWRITHMSSAGTSGHIFLTFILER